MDPEMTILSEVRERQIPYDITYVKSKIRHRLTYETNSQT